MRGSNESDGDSNDGREGERKSNEMELVRDGERRGRKRAKRKVRERGER